MLFSLHHCYNYNENYVILTLAMLKLQLTVCYFNYITVIITIKLCSSDVRLVKITILNMLFQVYCCYNRNKNYVFLTLRMSKLQYTIFYFNYITVIITIKVMYF